MEFQEVKLIRLWDGSTVDMNNIKNNICTSCNKNPIGKPKPCPYKSEINGNNEPCNCCDDCRSKCAQEI